MLGGGGAPPISTGNLTCIICNEVNGPDVFNPSDIPKDGFICPECWKARSIDDPTSIHLVFTDDDGHQSDVWARKACKLEMAFGIRDPNLGLAHDERPLITITITKEHDTLTPTINIHNQQNQKEEEDNP